MKNYHGVTRSKHEVARSFSASLYSCVFKLYIFFLILILSSCSKTEPSRTEFALGTVCSVTLFEHGKDRVYKDIFSRVREIENRMSVNIPASDLSRVNTAAGIEPVIVHEDVFFVLRRALHYAQITGGAFDPTVGPLVSLWGIGGDNPHVPSQMEIDGTLPLVNWRSVELDAAKQSVFLKNRGMSLDLGAIAKGYAADEAAAIIKKAGIEQAIIDFGGNIVVLGDRKHTNLWSTGSLWRIGIQNPSENRGIYIGLVQTKESGVVTSGVYERFFEKDGQRYHHIFSPFSGFPAKTGRLAENELLSVTIITQNSIDADALSTAAFVMGCVKGAALIESLPGTEAIFIFDDRSVLKTTNADFSLTDNSFSIVP